jgi:hypothetical protein
MRDFLLDVSHELNKSGIDLNIDDLDTAGSFHNSGAVV